MPPDALAFSVRPNSDQVMTATRSASDGERVAKKAESPVLSSVSRADCIDNCEPWKS